MQTAFDQMQALAAQMSDAMTAKDARISELTPAQQQTERKVAEQAQIIRAQQEALQAMQSRIIAAAKGEPVSDLSAPLAVDAMTITQGSKRPRLLG